MVSLFFSAYSQASWKARSALGLLWRPFSVDASKLSYQAIMKKMEIY